MFFICHFNQTFGAEHRIAMLFGKCLVLSLVLAVERSGATLTPQVDTSLGPVIGETLTFDGNTIHRYQGIPYALPPTGSRRFAPPEPPLQWTQTLNATSYRARCVANPQMDAFLYHKPEEAPAMSEDCLHLNIAVHRSGTLGPK